MKKTTVERQAFTAQDLAAYLGISLTSAYDLMHADDFPALRIRTGKGRGTVRVMKIALDEWIANQTKRPTSRSNYRIGERS